MVLIDGNGWPLSNPDAETLSYRATDQNSAAGILGGKCSEYDFAPSSQLPSGCFLGAGDFARLSTMFMTKPGEPD